MRMFLNEHVHQEVLGKGRVFVQRAQHDRFRDLQHGRRHHRARGAHAHRLIGEAAFAEEVAGPEHADHGFFPRRREHREGHAAVADVEHVGGRAALHEDDRAPPQLLGPAREPHGIQEGMDVKLSWRGPDSGLLGRHRCI